MEIDLSKVLSKKRYVKIAICWCGHIFYTASNNINYKSKKKCIKCLKRKDKG